MSNKQRYFNYEYGNIWCWNHKFILTMPKLEMSLIIKAFWLEFRRIYFVQRNSAQREIIFNFAKITFRCRWSYTPWNFLKWINASRPRLTLSLSYLNAYIEYLSVGILEVIKKPPENSSLLSNCGCKYLFAKYCILFHLTKIHIIDILLVCLKSVKDYCRRVKSIIIV